MNKLALRRIVNLNGQDMAEASILSDVPDNPPLSKRRERFAEGVYHECTRRKLRNCSFPGVRIHLLVILVFTGITTEHIAFSPDEFAIIEGSMCLVRRKQPGVSGVSEACRSGAVGQLWALAGGQRERRRSMGSGLRSGYNGMTVSHQTSGGHESPSSKGPRIQNRGRVMHCKGGSMRHKLKILVLAVP